MKPLYNQDTTRSNLGMLQLIPSTKGERTEVIDLGLRGYPVAKDVLHTLLTDRNSGIDRNR